MKNLIKINILIILSFIGLSACSDDNSDFVGEDHNIVSFSLENGNEIYVASISENKIVIDVPKYTDLNGSKVQYKLSENASIIPDPSTISNWNEDQVFRVESYDGEFSSYEFIVNSTNIINENDIIVKTQEDVDNILKSGITEIGGNLIIGEYYFPSVEFDTIKNLDALYKIDKVKNNIIINNTFCGNNIDGLANITEFGGFSIGTEISKSNIREKIDINFPNLIKANKIVVYTDKLVNFHAPKLSSVANFFLSSDNLLALDINSLIDVIKDFTITCDNSNGNSYMDNISLPNLTTVEGNIYINNLANLNKVNLDALTQVKGNLTLNKLIIKKVELNELKQVDGNFEFLYNKITSELALPKLENVGSIYISTKDVYNYKLTKLDLSKLKLVKGDLTIEYFSNTDLDLNELQSVEGELSLNSFYFAKAIELPKLKECSKLVIKSHTSLKTLDLNLLNKCEDVEITKLTALENINLSKIEKLVSAKLTYLSSISSIHLPQVIEGNLDYSGKDSIEFIGLESVLGTFSASVLNSGITFHLKGIKSIGSFKLSGTKLITVSLEDVEEIGDLYLGLNYLTTLSAPKLKKITNLTLYRTYVLKDIVCPLLTEISEKLSLSGGSSWGKSKMLMENVNIFSALNTIGSLEIKYCGNLKDFSGLKNAINSLSEDNWTVNNNLYNPSYQDILDKKYTNE